MGRRDDAPDPSTHPNQRCLQVFWKICTYSNDPYPSGVIGVGHPDTEASSGLKKSCLHQARTHDQELRTFVPNSCLTLTMHEDTVAMEKRVGRNIPKTCSTALVDVTCSSIAPNSILWSTTYKLFRRVIRIEILAMRILASITNTPSQPSGIPRTIQV